jgi:hypothetical protein
MRNKIIIIFTMFFTSILFNACKSNSSTSPTPPSASENYFPNGDGTTYKYSTVQTDSNGTQTSGTRSTTYKGTKVVNGNTFQIQIDTVAISGFSTSTQSYFLKSSSGVEYALDTTGLSQAIPDSLMQYIHFDASLKLLQTPLSDGSSWSVFNMKLIYGVFSINVVKVEAFYQGMEKVPLNLVSGNVNENAAKIKYVLTLTVPDLQNFTTSTVTYNAYAWFASGIGLIQLKGSEAILGAFSGSGVNLGDTTATVTQSLVSYNIK